MLAVGEVIAGGGNLKDSTWGVGFVVQVMAAHIVEFARVMAKLETQVRSSRSGFSTGGSDSRQRAAPPPAPFGDYNMRSCVDTPRMLDRGDLNAAMGFYSGVGETGDRLTAGGSSGNVHASGVTIVESPQ